MNAFEHVYEPVPPSEPNDFIRSEQEAAADEALRTATGSNPPPTYPDDKKLFEAAMRRFPNSAG